MPDDAQTCALLLDEIRDRLPLYTSEIAEVCGWRVVCSSYTGGAKAFVMCPVVEHDEFTSKTLRSVEGVVDELRRRNCVDVFLVFIDTGGSFSFYRVNTLRA
ncbi:hypothetical protein DQ04_00131150 [Trypanosoma grayi]|uniref:hypothetical protein n=1 Tax=Trypanosoma grayi TaxID=71804 RepID=UPI0004F4569A|nr:hypothetical protein DQ04_00131150 [Trypanosoma grayi]KEG15256.1 hypothetical protein DQ04_00131150 [Trypanosoma grayi]